MRPSRTGPVAAALALACAGCSFVAVRRPPAAPPAPDAPLECTESRVAPALDTAGAIVTPIAGVTAWGLCAFLQSMQSWSSEPRSLRCGTVLGATLLGTAAYAGSAWYGFHETGQCRRLVAERATPPAPGPEVPARPLPAHLAPAPPR